jgi:hypothetical protein
MLRAPVSPPQRRGSRMNRKDKTRRSCGLKRLRPVRFCGCGMWRTAAAGEYRVRGVVPTEAAPLQSEVVSVRVR